MGAQAHLPWGGGVIEDLGSPRTGRDEPAQRSAP
jgi:hypothetical protein